MLADPKCSYYQIKLLLGEHLKQRISNEDQHCQRAMGIAATATPAPTLTTSFLVEQKTGHVQDTQAY